VPGVWWPLLGFGLGMSSMRVPVGTAESVWDIAIRTAAAETSDAGC
jgi:hypothetical protein